MHRPTSSKPLHADDRMELATSLAMGPSTLQLRRSWWPRGNRKSRWFRARPDRYGPRKGQPVALWANTVTPIFPVPFILNSLQPLRHAIENTIRKSRSNVVTISDGLDFPTFYHTCAVRQP